MTNFEKITAFGLTLGLGILILVMLTGCHMTIGFQTEKQRQEDRTIQVNASSRENYMNQNEADLQFAD